MALTTEEALRMIGASHAKAKEANAAISTAIVDAGGHVLALVRMERASWLTGDSARALAYTSAGFGTAGARLERFNALPWFQALTVQSGGLVVAGNGSLAIKREGAVIGAIACSGASDEVDLACAEAGLAAL